MGDPASKSNEEVLLQGLKSGREEAYRSLVETYSERLFRLAARILGREEDAREVLQEVFLKVVSKIENFQGGSSLYTWLYRITVNEALMRKRTFSSRPEQSFEELLPRYEFGYLAEDTKDWSRLPDRSFESKEFRTLIRTCVDELPEPLKSAYVLKDMEELSEDEVCDILEITKPTMKNRVHRARLILRKRIEEKYAA